MKHLFDCEHPRMVTNKYTSKRIQVGCGYCPACRLKRATRWISSLIRESDSHHYVYFVTLTYSGKYLPKIELASHDSSGILHCTYKVDKKYEKSFKKFYYLGKEYIEFCNGSIPYCPSSDIQLFIKRLRENIYRRFGLRKALRYFFSSDYGSTLFRPHWHGLLFFDDPRIGVTIQSLLAESWSVYDKTSCRSEQIGIIEAEPSYAASQYVSAYIHSAANRPLIYEYRDFKCKSFHSSLPPIGSQIRCLESFEEIVRQGLTQITIYNNFSYVWQKVSIPPYLVRRLFPKIPRYFQLSSFERCSIYRSFVELIGLDPFARCGTIIEKCLVNSFLCDYINDNEILDFEQFCSKVNRLYYCVFNIHIQALSFGMSYSEYDDCINRYYTHLKSFGLSKQFDYEETYSLSNDDMDLLLNMIDLDRTPSKNSYTTPFSFDHDYFLQVRQKYNKFIKRKCDNAYLNKHPEYKHFH